MEEAKGFNEACERLILFDFKGDCLEQPRVDAIVIFLGEDSLILLFKRLVIFLSLRIFDCYLMLTDEVLLKSTELCLPCILYYTILIVLPLLVAIMLEFFV